MEIKEFIEKFAEAVEIDETDKITSETTFRNLDEWSSLAALSVIAMFDEEFDIVVNGNDIRSSKTIGDLYNLLQQ